jgi:hypothetical protein
MKRIIITISMIVLFIGALSSQNRIFIGEKAYPCSETFTFTYPHPHFLGEQNLDIKFIKDKDIGMIALTIKTDIGEYDRIKGKILIYLDNETVITCLDRNKYDYVNGKATTIYYLTKEEINKMKKSNINAIRFSTVEGNYEADKNHRGKTSISDIVNDLFNN